MQRLLAVISALALAACGDDLPAKRARPVPAPDGRAALLGGEALSPRIASYRIDARLDAAARRITATETLTWTNTGASAVTSVPLHLYMNAFKNEQSVFMRESQGRHRGIEASDGGWGWIEVTAIRIAGVDVLANATQAGPDETLLDLRLPQPLEPGQTIAIDLEFTTQLPEVFARTGYKGEFMLVGQWFPKIGVRVGPPGAERWHATPFHLASEFFADFGTYDVTLTVPGTHVVAATGVLASATDNGDGTHTLVYRAEDVHDFVWMADPYMDVIRGTAKVAGGEVEVRVYHRPPQRDFAERHLAAGVGAIETFSELFYPYPWPIMSIVDPPPGAEGAGGMEYPTLVTAAGDHWTMRDGIRFPEYVTIHEVGHNWFQGILASNEVDEAWLDEGVNEWADGEVIARLYGERGGIVDWRGWQLELQRIRRVTIDPGDIPSPIATASWAFVDFDAYADATYTKTALALGTVENLVGRDRFLAAMKAYAEAWAFRHPTGRDLFASLEASLGEDLSWFWGPAFHGTGAADFAVRTAACRPKREPRGVFGRGDQRELVTGERTTGAYACEVVVVDRGDIPVPVDVELKFEDGTRVRERWDRRGGGRWHRFAFDRSSPLAEVTIDPDRRVLLLDDPLDDRIRLEPDQRASWRAAARVAFWTQTVMQAVGL